MGLGVQRAAAEEVVQKAEPKPKFRRLPRIQFIAALGDPAGAAAHSQQAFALARARQCKVTQWGPLANACPESELPLTILSAASSGTGADKWGLWEEDPGPRGVRLGNYGKLAKTKGKAPVWWAEAVCFWLPECAGAWVRECASIALYMVHVKRRGCALSQPRIRTRTHAHARTRVRTHHRMFARAHAHRRRRDCSLTRAIIYICICERIHSPHL